MVSASFNFFIGPKKLKAVSHGQVLVHTFGSLNSLPPSLPTLLPSQNYGDESDAYGLIYPSLYSNRGVYEEDFFAARQPQEVSR